MVVFTALLKPCEKESSLTQQRQEVKSFTKDSAFFHSVLCSGDVVQFGSHDWALPGDVSFRVLKKMQLWKAMRFLQSAQKSQCSRIVFSWSCRKVSVQKDVNTIHNLCFLFLSVKTHFQLRRESLLWHISPVLIQSKLLSNQSSAFLRRNWLYTI